RMKPPHRRDFLHLAAGAATLAAISPVAWAQTYPSRPVRWIVAFAAGGPTDIVARIMGQYLSERMGQQFIIDNRPGAGGIVGTQAAINSPADGYTLLMVAHVHAINATLYQKLPYCINGQVVGRRGSWRTRVRHGPIPRSRRARAGTRPR
ncbi:MAG TPA: tripartite tricarboxylate transporter substrate-binding protein, partial [Hyphomicrobiaceae bacterium]